MKTRTALSLIALVVVTAVVTAACSTGAGASPSPTTPGPTPTPIGATVETPEEAAALVIATDPKFAGVTKQNPNVIGASAWWEAQPLDGGGYRITVTIGWGDCPAGCINRHIWTFDVSADGQVTLVSEAGDALPAGNVLPG